MPTDESSSQIMTGTSMRILALMVTYVSVRETSYMLDGKEDVHSYVSALRLDLKYSKGEISQWRPVGHEWSTCCMPVTVPCLFITRRTPLCHGRRYTSWRHLVLVFFPSNRLRPA